MADADIAPASLDTMTGGAPVPYPGISGVRPTPGQSRSLEELAPSQPDTSATEKKLTNIRKSEAADIERNIGDQDAAWGKWRSRMEGVINEERLTRADFKPWNAELEVAKRQTNMWEAFASPGFLVAMLGSAFSAMPMNAALQAGGAAINAINQGNREDYERAFEAWQKNTDLAIKRSELEHREFEDIAHLAHTNLEEFGAKFKAYALKYDNQRLGALYEGGMFKEIFEAQEASAKAREAVQKSRDYIVDRHAFENAVRDNPNWKEFEKTGDHTLAQKAINEEHAKEAQAKYTGRFTGTLSGLESVAIQDRAQVLMNEAAARNEKLDYSTALNQAAKEIAPSFRAQGRSPQAIFLQKFQQEHPDATSQDIQHVSGLFNEIQARARTLGVRSANIDVNVDEAEALAQKTLLAGFLGGGAVDGSFFGGNGPFTAGSRPRGRQLIKFGLYRTNSGFYDVHFVQKRSHATRKSIWTFFYFEQRHCAILSCNRIYTSSRHSLRISSNQTSNTVCKFT